MYSWRPPNVATETQSPEGDYKDSEKSLEFFVCARGTDLV